MVTINNIEKVFTYTNNSGIEIIKGYISGPVEFGYEYVGPNQRRDFSVLDVSEYKDVGSVISTGISKTEVSPPNGQIFADVNPATEAYILLARDARHEGDEYVVVAVNRDVSKKETPQVIGEIEDSDDKFDGTSHPSLPPVARDFSCKNNDTATSRPEAVVDITEDGEWVRLPVVDATTTINKDGAADITRTAEITAPATWGRSRDGEKVQIYDLIGIDGGQDPNKYDEARVYYWNDYVDRYQLVHFGYVGGVGPARENGVVRFFAYDVADMLPNVSVGKSWDNPTAPAVVQYVTNQLTANTHLSVNGFSTTAQGETVDVVGAIESFDIAFDGWVNENVPIITIDENTNDQFLNPEWQDDFLKTGGHKHFTRNRHTLVDILEWLTNEIGGSWYFKPSDDGVTLVVNNGTENTDGMARTSYTDGQEDLGQLDYVRGYNPAPVDVLQNTSLEDLKPINYLELDGETVDSFLGGRFDGIKAGLETTVLGAPEQHSDKYPHIEVSYPPLLERTDGFKVGPRKIESGATTLAEARQQAIEAFLQRHEDNTDGSIVLRGTPSIRPFDYMTSVPVCNTIFDADMNPIQYEVNEVVHRSPPDGHYKTELGVSLAIDESQLEITQDFLNET
ncbi:hypothetical protein HAPG_00018 [Halorubrum phage GNf2]|nr:hypothetical protein HAPG_00018 [Halorubrum phage GNf2]